MTEWQMKRFWTETAVVEEAGKFGIVLDGRPVRTPGKTPLLMPTRALAEAACEEWDAQIDIIDPLSMPVTRAANTAIDKTSVQFEDVAAHLTEYGETDLLCYRAEGPEGLVQRQADAWDPLLDWAEAALGARLVTGVGVMHIAQDPDAVARLGAQVRVLDPFRLTAFSELVTISGSLVLGFAVTEGARSPDDAFDISRIDERWQIDQWGEDEEATRQSEARRRAFLDAARIFKLT